MTERILVFNPLQLPEIKVILPAKIDEDTGDLLPESFYMAPSEAVLARARQLDCPSVLHGFAPWMRDRGYNYGADGYVCVIVCSIPTHNAAREILAILTGTDITAANIAAVQDCPPDLPTQEELDRERLQVLTEKQTLSPLEILESVKLAARLILR